jgi:hypothetical protein
MVIREHGSGIIWARRCTSAVVRSEVVAGARCGESI